MDIHSEREKGASYEPQAEAVSPKTGEAFYGWYILGGLFVIYFTTFGFTMYAAAVSLPTMIEQMGWSRAASSAGIAILFIMTGLGGLPAVYLLRRFGAKPTMLFGAGLIMAGAVCVYTTTTLWQYYVGLGLLIGLGKAHLAIVPAQQIIANWFLRRRALALGILLTSSGLATFIVAPVGAAMIESSGDWRQVWLLAMFGSVVCAFIVVFIMREKPDSIQTAYEKIKVDADGKDKTQRLGRIYHSSIDWPVKDALKSFAYWKLNISAAVVLIGVTIVNSQSILHLQDIGLNAILAASVLGVTGLTGIFGRLAAGGLGDRIDPKLLLLAGISLEAASFLVLMFSTTPMLMYLFAALFGTGLGIAVVSLAALMANYFGKNSYGSLVAAQMLTVTLIAGMGPIVAGRIQDMTGSYNTVFMGYIVLALFMAGVIATLKPPHLKNMPESPTSI